MATTGVPKGKSTEGMGVDAGGGKVNMYNLKATNSMGIPAGQAPGIDKGTKDLSMNQLPSNAAVIKSAKSNLMTGSSQNRGSGGNK